MGRSKREDRYARLLADAWRLEGINPHVDAAPATEKQVPVFKSAMDYCDQLWATYTPATIVQKPAGKKQAAGQGSRSCAVVHSNATDCSVAEHRPWWTPEKRLQHGQEREKESRGSMRSPLATGGKVLPRAWSCSGDAAQHNLSRLRRAWAEAKQNGPDPLAPCGVCSQWGHHMLKCPELWGPQASLCWRCGQQGHGMETCPVLSGSPGGIGGQETKTPSLNPRAQVSAVAPSNTVENCLAPTGGAQENWTASAETQRTQIKPTMGPENGGKTVVHALYAGTAYASVTETDRNPAREVGVTPVRRPTEPFVRGLPLQSACQSWEACVKNVCSKAMLPCKLKADEGVNSTYSDQLYTNVDVKSIDEGQIDIDACYMWCNSGDKTALPATKGAVAEVSLETPVRLNSLEPEASRDGGSAALLGTVETATRQGKQLKLVQNVEHTSECNAQGEWADGDIDAKGVFAEPMAQGADCPTMSWSMFERAELNDIVAQCTREQVPLSGVVPPAQSNVNVVKKLDLGERDTRSGLVTEGLRQTIAVQLPDTALFSPCIDLTLQSVAEGNTDNTDWDGLARQWLAILEGVSLGTSGADTISTVPERGTAGQLMEEGTQAAAAHFPHPMEGPSNTDRTAEILSGAPENEPKRGVTVVNLKDDDAGGLVSDDVFKDIGGDLVTYHEGDWSEQWLVEMRGCEIAAVGGCSEVAESSIDAALPNNDIIRRQEVVTGDVTVGDDCSPGCGSPAEVALLDNEQMSRNLKNDMMGK